VQPQLTQGPHSIQQRLCIACKALLLHLAAQLPPAALPAAQTPASTGRESNTSMYLAKNPPEHTCMYLQKGEPTLLYQKLHHPSNTTQYHPLLEIYACKGLQAQAEMAIVNAAVRKLLVSRSGHNQ
jgi:hypothetical protein